MQNRTPSTPDELPDFTPVPRQYRQDGWTPERQRAFIEALADTGSVKHAAKRINMSSEGAYYLRRQPGAEEFTAAWAKALDHGVQRLEDIALERATHGVEVPVYSYGKLVGSRIVHNDRLLMFMLRNPAADRFAAGASGKRLDVQKPRDPYEDEHPNDPHVIERVRMAVAEMRNQWETNVAQAGFRRMAGGVQRRARSDIAAGRNRRYGHPTGRGYAVAAVNKQILAAF